MGKKTTIIIEFTRKVTFNKIITLDEKEATRALALDGEDLSAPRSSDGSDDFKFIAEDLVDFHDVLDAANEITNLSVRVYKAKP